MTPSKLDPIDISTKPQRPSKDYVKFLKTLPDPWASSATNPFINQPNDPEESPVLLSSKVLFILRCIQQQTATPDDTIPFLIADRVKALFRITDRRHMDNADNDDFITANDTDKAFYYYSRHTHTNPHILLGLKTDIPKVQSTPITQDWFIATKVLGCHCSLNPPSKTQQSLFCYFNQKNPSSTTKNPTAVSSKPKSNHKTQSTSSKKTIVEEVIGPGPTDHIKNKTKNPTSKQTAVSFASSTKPPKGGQATPPTSKDPSSTYTATSSKIPASAPPKDPHSTATSNPTPELLPSCRCIPTWSLPK